MNNITESEFTKKELILKATLNLIKKQGFEGVTMRKIASEAKVNVGLVNYHFGSKDKLINAVIQILVDSLKETFTILDDDSIEPRQRLKQFLLQYVNAYYQYPFIAQRMLVEGTIIFDSQKEFIHFMKAFGIKKMQHTVEQLIGKTEPETLIIIMSHLLGATFLPALIEPLYEKVTGFRFPEMEKRIDLLLDRYFSDANSEET